VWIHSLLFLVACGGSPAAPSLEANNELAECDSDEDMDIEPDVDADQILQSDPATSDAKKCRLENGIRVCP